MAFTMCASAWAASVRVTGAHVRLRLNPSLNAAIYTDSYGTPIYPSKGQVLSWTGYNSNGFYEVSFHGRTLWIHSSYARPVNQATASIPENVLITGNKVPITTYPDTKSQGGRLLACLLRFKRTLNEVVQGSKLRMCGKICKFVG